MHSYMHACCKELSVHALVKAKEEKLEQCQDRLRTLIEDEERRRKEALTVLHTFPRRGSAARVCPLPPPRPTGGALAFDSRAAAVVASLLDQIQFQVYIYDIHIYVCIYMCVYIHTYTHTYIHT
jgi:hypothetical protein